MITPLNKRLVTVAAVAAFLAGCSGASQTAPSSSQAIPQTSHIAGGKFSLSSKPFNMAMIHKSNEKSWASPDATKAKALLYVSNLGNGTVTFYRYSGGTSTQKGTISGFDFPTPGCTDNKGNVFIPDLELEQITEYAYGSTNPTQVLSDSGYEPFGCSVDPTTGNLAVANFGSGSVSVYADANGTPSVLPVSDDALTEYVAYDNTGDLFAAGRNETSGVYILDEASSGTTTFSPVTVSGGTIAFPGQIQWGGSYLLLGDQGEGESSVNQATVSAGTATIVKNIPLVGSGDVVGGYKRGSAAAGNATYAGPDYELDEGNNYSFPGGSNIGTYSGISSPYGAVIVNKK
jgi:hypothetical protein